MIKASLDVVQLTKANYELCDLFKTTPQETDFVVKAEKMKGDNNGLNNQ